MTRFAVSDDELEVEQSTRFFAWSAIFFLVLGSLLTVIGVGTFVTGDGDIEPLARGVLSVGVGLALGAMPRQRLLVVPHASDELVWRQRTLYSRKETRVPLRDVTAVAVTVGDRWNFVSIVHRDGPRIDVMSFVKTWIWNTAAPAHVLEYGRRLAAFLRVPLETGAAAVTS